MDFLDTWQFNLVAYLVSIVIFFQCNKVAVRQAKDDAAATLILQFIATPSILLLVPFFPVTFPTELLFYGLLLLASVFYALNDRLQTPVRKHLQVSVFSILNQLVFIFIFAYGLVIFNEPFDLTKLLGVLLIISANIALFFKRGQLKPNKYMIMGLIAAFALATAITIDIEASKVFNLPIYIALTLLVPALCIMAVERVSYRRIRQEYSQVHRKAYLAAGVAWAATIYFSLRSLQLGEVTTVVPLQSLSVLLNVIVAYIFLRERQEVIKKLLLAGLAVVGIILTVI